MKDKIDKIIEKQEENKIYIFEEDNEIYFTCKIGNINLAQVTNKGNTKPKDIKRFIDNIIEHRKKQINNSVAIIKYFKPKDGDEFEKMITNPRYVFKNIDIDKAFNKWRLNEYKELEVINLLKLK